MNSEEIKLEELSREQILDLAGASGRKLGVLLATSDLTDEVEESIIDILKFATPAQIDALTKMLEQGYLEAKNQEFINFLSNQLEKIKSEFDEAQKELEQEILEKLKNL